MGERHKPDQPAERAERLSGQLEVLAWCVVALALVAVVGAVVGGDPDARTAAVGLALGSAVSWGVLMALATIIRLQLPGTEPAPSPPTGPPVR